jgi:Na+/H+ antiporter NhaD/arsenite permease-like protein
VSWRAIFVSALVTAGLVGLAVWLLGFSLDRAAILAPLFVAVVGSAAALVVLWARVGWESLRHREHPWRIVALALGLFALLVVLSTLGVKLPRE